jgi:hypothetical protein
VSRGSARLQLVTETGVGLRSDLRGVSTFVLCWSYMWFVVGKLGSPPVELPQLYIRSGTAPHRREIWFKSPRSVIYEPEDLATLLG